MSTNQRVDTGSESVIKNIKDEIVIGRNSHHGYDHVKE